MKTYEEMNWKEKIDALGISTYEKDLKEAMFQTSRFIDHCKKLAILYPQKPLLLDEKI